MCVCELWSTHTGCFGVNVGPTVHLQFPGLTSNRAVALPHKECISPLHVPPNGTKERFY